MKLIALTAVALSLAPAAAGAQVVRQVEFGGYDSAYAVATGPGGTFLIAGDSLRAGADIAVARMRLDGSLDRSFGAGGRVVLNFGGAERIRAIARDNAGRILLAGAIEREGNQKWLLVRLLPDGRLDQSFGGGDGRVTLAPRRWDADCAAVGGVVALPGGGIVASGFAGCGGEGGDGIRAAVARLRADGRLDRSFARAGVWQTWSLCGADALAVQASGRILIAGTSGDHDYCEGGHMRLVGVASSGRLDRSFGRSGRTDIKASRRGDSGVRDLSFTPSGRILAAGWAEGAGRSGFAVARLDAAGHLDTSFGLLRGPSLGGRTGGATGVTTSASGQVVLSGFRSFGRNRSQFVLARYSGGRGTRQVIPFGGNSAAAWGLASVAGRTVAVGESARGEDSDFAIAILP